MVETLSRWPGYFTTYLESGLFITVTTTIVATALTIVWALVVTAVRVNPIKPLRFLAIAYIELFRGTPILVQLFTIFFGLSFLGLLIPAWPATVLALMLNAGGYLAESYRAGFQAVPQGQREAALAIGMSRPLALRRVVIPQAFRVIVPAIGNITISILLTTPIAALIGNPDLLFQSSQVESTTHDPSVLIEMILIYAVLALSLAWLNSRVEARLRLP
jgi:arginine/lysine/histidine transport system permease protein